MTYIPDLSPCWYISSDASNDLLAVGWLEQGREFSSGHVDRKFFEKLVSLLLNPWQPCAAAGFHECSFCRFSGGPKEFRWKNTGVSVGCSNVFVPDDHAIYVAPSLILHYIDAHGYSPPDAFQRAVLSCPEMRSIDYLKLLKANGLAVSTAKDFPSSM